MIIEIENDIIKIKGKLDRNYWPATQAAAAMMLGEGRENIIVDCGGVTEITEKGLNTFAQAFSYMNRRNIRVLFVDADEKIEKLAMKTPGIRSSMPIAESIEEARAAIVLNRQSDRKIREKNMIFPILGNPAHAIMFFDNIIKKNTEFNFVYPLIIPRKYYLYHPVKSLENKANADLMRAEGFSIFLSRQSKGDKIRSRDYKGFFRTAEENYPNSSMFISFAGMKMDRRDNKDKLKYFIERENLKGVAVTEPFSRDNPYAKKEIKKIAVYITDDEKINETLFSFAKKLNKNSVRFEFVKPVKLKFNESPFSPKNCIDNFTASQIKDPVYRTESVRSRRRFVKTYTDANSIDIFIMPALRDMTDMIAELSEDPKCIMCFVSPDFVL